MFPSPFALVLAAALSVATTAQSITGTVLDNVGNPVAGATLALSNGAPGGITAANGTFAIAGLRARNANRANLSRRFWSSLA